MAKPSKEKDEFYWKVLNAAVSLEIRRGHMKWTLTELARTSKASRTLIYYYFGKSKGTILAEAVRLFGEELSGATAERHALWKEGKIAQTYMSSRSLLEKVPALVPFYFLNRKLDNEIGAAIRKQEGRFKGKVAQYFSKLSAEKVEGLCALFFGLSFAPEVSDAAIDAAVKILGQAAAD